MYDYEVPGTGTFFQCCGSGRMRMFVPDLNFSHPGSESTSKNLSFLAHKIVSQLSEYDPGCSYRFRIPDPGSDFLPIPDPGVTKAPNPGSRSATLPFLAYCNRSFDDFVCD